MGMNGHAGISARKVRASVGVAMDTLQSMGVVVQGHADALEHHADAISKVSLQQGKDRHAWEYADLVLRGRVADLERVARGSFWGRLRWLLRGE